MIPLLLLAIAHRFTPRHNEALDTRDLCNPWAGKDHLFFGKRTTERTPTLLCFSRQPPRPGFKDVAVIACHHHGTLRQVRFIEQRIEVVELVDAPGRGAVGRSWSDDHPRHLTPLPQPAGSPDAAPHARLPTPQEHPPPPVLPCETAAAASQDARQPANQRAPQSLASPWRYSPASACRLTGWRATYSVTLGTVLTTNGSGWPG